jgi:hypothetical protein
MLESLHHSATAKTDNLSGEEHDDNPFALATAVIVFFWFNRFDHRISEELD